MYLPVALWLFKTNTVISRCEQKCCLFCAFNFKGFCVFQGWSKWDVNIAFSG